MLGANTNGGSTRAVPDSRLCLSACCGGSRAVQVQGHTLQPSAQLAEQVACTVQETARKKRCQEVRAG